MIFAIAKSEPAVFLMLDENDVQKMRRGHTLFVDERATKGAIFNKVILSLHKTNDAAVELLKSTFGSGTVHQPIKNEIQCKGCDGIMGPEQLFEDKCIVCWANEVKNLKARMT